MYHQSIAPLHHQYRFYTCHFQIWINEGRIRQNPRAHRRHRVSSRRRVHEGRLLLMAFDFKRSAFHMWLHSWIVPCVVVCTQRCMTPILHDTN
uniref:Uncharacterized protein n=1 Tax=Romanomermis culicivorax TaxID=13658 RepID=A0A915HM27_ROMCU